MLKNFAAAYKDCKGEATLLTNRFLESTFDFKALADEFRADEFTLGGFKHTYLTGVNCRICVRT